MFLSQTYNCGPLSNLKLKLNNEEKFERHMLNWHSPANLTVREHNYFLEVILPYIFLGKYNYSNNEILIVNEVLVDFPTHTVNGKKERITPLMAQTLGISYMNEIFLKASTSLKHGEMLIPIGSIPAMLGSSRCYLSTKPNSFYGSLDEWKFYCSRCPSIPDGTFINKGMPKVLINQERLRTSVYLTFIRKKKFLDTRVTSVNGSETVVTYLTSSLNMGNVNIKIKEFKEEIPLYLCVFLMCLKAGINYTFDFKLFNSLVTSFVSKQIKGSIEAILDFNREIYMEKFVFGGKTDGNAIISFLGDKNAAPNSRRNPTVSSLDEVSSIMFNKCFEQCETFNDKIINLAYMTAQHLRCYVMDRRYDNRDFWGNKRVETRSRAIEKLLSKKFSEISRDTEKNKISQFGSSSDKDAITKLFKDAFNTKSWGTNAMDKENISEDAKSDTQLMLNAQLIKINPPVDRSTKDFNQRGVVPSQFGGICPFKTPEDRSCGLIKFFAATPFVSYNRCYEGKSKNVFDKLLTKASYTSFEPNEKCRYLIYVNGVPYENLYGSSKFAQACDTEVIDGGIYLNTYEGKYTSVIHWSGVPINVPFGLEEQFCKINDLVSTRQSRHFKAPLTVNGTPCNIVSFNKINYGYPVICWFNPEETLKYLKDKRRANELPRDCCITYVGSDNTIQYYDDGGRVLVAYLVVDKDGNLVADKHKLFDKIEEDYNKTDEYIEMFYREGAMELVDLKEYDTSFIAETIQEVRAFRNLREFLNLLYPLEDNKTVFTKEMLRTYTLYMADLRLHHKRFLSEEFYTSPVTVLLKYFPFFNEEIFRNLGKYLSIHRFTHCLPDPINMLSPMCAITPWTNHEQAGRVTFQASMITQALTIPTTLPWTAFDAGNKRLIAPKPHLAENIGEEPYGLSSIPFTENVIMAIWTDKNNYEDPVIMSKSFADRFMFYENDASFKVIESEGLDSSSDFTEVICKPAIQGNAYKYRHLDERGLPKLGSIIQEGDCIVGKMKVSKDRKTQSNSSLFACFGDTGEVIGILVSCDEETSKKRKVVKIKIASKHHQIVGDKIASRYSQKGTIGQIKLDDGSITPIVDDSSMPIIKGGPNDGVRPHLLFNPAGMPSRMTCGKMFETLMSKACAFSREKVISDTFHFKGLDYYMDILIKNGMDKWGREILVHSDGEIVTDSTTGKPLMAFVGICAYQILRHHVENKWQARGIGSIDPMTRQPTRGKNRHGGLRIGEMETDALITHAGANLVTERLMGVSDQYTCIVCRNCNSMSNGQEATRNHCNICNVDGQLVAVVQPRSTMLFLQYLRSSGINTEFYTELC